MRTSALLAVTGFGIAAFGLMAFRLQATDRASHPVLVELFTSEGCSSCPPADALLAKLDREAIPDAEPIVLSEHVDYWNHLGWSDPFSSPAYTLRQQSYVRKFKLESAYTPQMVVDGVTETLGSDETRVRATIARQASIPKAALRLTVGAASGASLPVTVDVDSVPAFAGSKADVVLVLAESSTASIVRTGENAGHRLEHVSVARMWDVLGSVESGGSFHRSLNLKVPRGMSGKDLRLVAFVQLPGPGAVLGAAKVAVR